MGVRWFCAEELGDADETTGRGYQEAFFVAADQLPKSDGHAFYTKLNSLLKAADFDEFVESRCQKYYDRSGNDRPSIPPGVYFRILLVGYWEGIGS